jgi:signal transduction histidine kinase
VRGEGATVEWRRYIDSQAFERKVNAHTAETLRNASLGALAVLFPLSLGLGWLVAGRALRPIGRITDVARDIQATSLERRIGLGGPDDELRRLADTFDAMLGRIDTAFAAQRRFVADASHELRNPLAIIRTNNDVSLADPALTREAARRARRIATAADRMTGLVDDLLAMARLQVPGARREAVSLVDVGAQAVEEVAAIAAERSIRVRAPAGVAPPVTGDRMSLARAVANLLDNALRHAPPGSSVTVEVGARDGWAWLVVHDDGPGIPLEDQPRIFNRFYRVDRARSREDGGSGLGLAIVRQIAEGHGGAIRVVSEPGHGATFVLWVPLGDVAGPPPADHPSRTGPPGERTPVAAGAPAV